MRAHQDIDRAPLEIRKGLFLLGGAPEAAEEVDAQRKVLEPLREIVVVLLSQYGGRHEEDDLIALLYHLKGRAERNLGLAVAHVSADQAVHDSSLFEVRLDIRNCLQLISGLRVGKELFKLGLPHRIRPVAVTFFLEPRRVEGHQFLCDFTDGALNPRLGLAPLRTPEAV